MDNTDEIRESLKALFSSQNLAVLATHQDGQPYASLVAFVASDDLRYLYFVTPKSTRKFANLTADPRVALLVNSSLNQTADFHRAIAVTVVGTAREIKGADREKRLDAYLAKHPHLEDFAKSPSCAPIEVRVKSYHMVKNFQHVMELHISE